MSDEMKIHADQLNPTADAAADEEFEEISSDEVDRVAEALEQLIESIDSENIQALLEEASNSILSLVYDDEDLEVDEERDEAA